MTKYIFKLNFKAPVHFGNGKLGDSENCLFADTVFSALFNEAINMYGENHALKLLNSVNNGHLLLSDLFLYVKNTLFVPKPFVTIESDNQGDSVLKKKFKKLKFIPVESLSDFVLGKFDPEISGNLLKNVGKKSVETKVKINKNEDNVPYNVGVYTFSENCGLYFVAMLEDNIKDLFVSLVESISFTGLGGKRYAGYGRFEYEYFKAPQEFDERLKDGFERYMSLSVCLAKENELEKTLDGASYDLVKRSGYVWSDTYSQKPLRKNDMYCFKSGSVFKNTFSGDVFDVSNNGNHPVYRYAKPMFFGLD